MMTERPSERLRERENLLQAQLRAWYTQPGIQSQLLAKENAAIREVLDLLDRRRRDPART